MSLKILVVEDDDLNREMMKEMLEVLDYCSEVVASGAHALQWLQNAVCDLILMDLHMPDMGGQEVARQIRKLPLYAEPFPIIAVTADIEAGKSVHSFSMTDFLLKPFTVDQLQHVVQKHVCTRLN